MKIPCRNTWEDKILFSCSWKLAIKLISSSRPKISKSSQFGKPTARLFKSIANGNAISWFCFPIRNPLAWMLRQVPVREFSSLSKACFRDFQRAAAEPWDFRRYPAGIRDISTLNSPQVVRNGSVGVYIYIFYTCIERIMLWRILNCALHWILTVSMLSLSPFLVFSTLFYYLSRFLSCWQAIFHDMRSKQSVSTW